MKDKKNHGRAAGKTQVTVSCDDAMVDWLDTISRERGYNNRALVVRLIIQQFQREQMGLKADFPVSHTCQASGCGTKNGLTVSGKASERHGRTAVMTACPARTNADTVTA